MKRIILLIVLFITVIAHSQEHAWVYFNDKPNEATFMGNPISMLTQRSLDRRIQQNIPLDYFDVPISNVYINNIIAIAGIQVKAKSKWLNAVHVLGLEADINTLESLPFVDHVTFADNGLNAKMNSVNATKEKFDDLVLYNYGGSANQSSQIGVNYLHENDFTGSGMQIAILDAGFPNVDNFPAFQYIRDNNQILGTYNFVHRTNDVYQDNHHGTAVLSTIAGFDDGNLVGTALEASFYLFTTEDNSGETPYEESLWVEAAEKADSLGVDVINTSLGYQDFDEPKYDHLYANMDGNTTFISQGANIAVSRGMIVVVAAGNDGVDPNYNNIASPADATNVFTIGAVDENDAIAYFSSFGPTYDGRIKPDVCAKGLATTLVGSSGAIGTGNGTSFASPVMAGAITCLWQAFPTRTNMEIMQYVRESAHLFNNPTNQEGYGIPNMQLAFQLAKVDDSNIDEILIYPNPVTVSLYIENTKKQMNAKLFDILGRLVVEKNFFNSEIIELKHLKAGIYLLSLDDGENAMVSKIIKR